MKKTSSERVRAKRLRDKRAKGVALSDDDATFLRDYEGTTRVTARVVEERRAEEAPRVTYVADEVKGEVYADFKPVSFDVSEPSPSAPIEEHAACGIVDCPRCRAVDNAPVCGTTGLKVYPRMSEESGKALAGVALTVTTIVARLFGRVFKATEHDTKALGKALAEVIYRRAGWTGAVDDIIALAFVVGGLATRVYNAPKAVVDTTAESQG